MGVGREARGGGKLPWILKVDIFLLKVLAKRLFS